MLKNGIIWILGLTIALAVALSAMGAIAKNKAPDLAVTLQPVNGFASEKLASNSLKTAIAANQGQFPDDVGSKAATFAKRAFLSEPLTPEAITVLALGRTESSERKLMLQAFALSRRQRLVTGWMIADSAIQEDIPAILHYYDTMLRTSGSAASVVIPIMAGALENKNFVKPFADLLSKNPPWANRFWGTVVTTPEAIGNAADLRALLYKTNEEKKSYRDASLINALVNDKQFQAAENLYRLLVDQKKSDSLFQNGSFERNSTYPPLDWQLVSTGEYGATITGGNLQLSAIRNSGGLFARQLVKLPPAVLTVSVKSNAAIPQGADLSIRISCAETLKNAPRRISIPLKDTLTTQQISNRNSGCSFYWLEIEGRARGNGEGFDVGLDSVSLELK